MKKLIAVLLALVMCSVMMISHVSADSVIVDFGDVAGELGDVDVDTFITATDLVTLRKILITEIQPQSNKTANVNGADGVDIRDLHILQTELQPCMAASLIRIHGFTRLTAQDF